MKSTLRIASLVAAVFMVVGAAAAHSFSIGPLPGVGTITLPNQLPVAIGGPDGNLIYGGGPVVTGPTTTYAIFWEPPGSVGPGYNDLITRFLTDVGGSSDYGIASQYYEQLGGPSSRTFIANASTFGGAWVDPRPYPSFVQPSDIQAEFHHALDVNHWTATSDHLFYVFTGSDESTCTVPLITELYVGPPMCSGSPLPLIGYCGTSSATQSAPGGPVGSLFTYIPYPQPNALSALLQTGVNCMAPTSPNNNPAADSAINLINFHLINQLTNPGHQPGWTAANGLEAADVCAEEYGHFAADGSDIQINGHPYVIQKSWSNATSSCAL
jgi:hypothetical protein